MDLDKLQLETERLLDLLRDPRPGLTVWILSLAERLRAIVTIADDNGIKPE